MAQYDMTDAPRLSGWAIGGISFAGTMLIMIGLPGDRRPGDDLQRQVLPRNQNYTFDLDVTAWGWIHLFLGILMVLTGFSIFAAAVGWIVATALPNPEDRGRAEESPAPAG